MEQDLIKKLRTFVNEVVNLPLYTREYEFWKRSNYLRDNHRHLASFIDCESSKLVNENRNIFR